MIPSVYSLLSGSTSIAAVFNQPPRIYPWGEAPQGVEYPYATWGVVTATPENYLGQVPDIDGISVQIDVWARTRRVLAGESYLSEEDGDDITPMAGVDDDRPLAPSNVPKVIDNDSYNASYGIVLWTVLGASVWGAAYLIWRAFI